MIKQFYTKYLFLFLLTLQCTCLSAQNTKIIDSLDNLLKSASNDTSKFSALINLADQYQDFNSDKALKYGQDAFNLSLQLKNPRKTGFAENKLGDLSLHKGDYGSASGHYFNALKIYENLKDNYGLSRIYHNIGEIYYSQKNYNEALNYYKKSLTIFPESKNKSLICANYNDIGIICTILKNYDAALKSYQNVLKIAEESGNKQGIAVSYANISIVYYEMGKLSPAIQYAKKALKIDEEIGNINGILANYGNLGELYIHDKKYEEAAIALKNGMQYTKETNDKSLIKSIYDNFAVLYEKQNDFEKADEYAKLASDLKDSIYDESNSRQTNEMTAKYESEKKELMINSLEKEKVHEKKFRMFLIIFCVLIAAFTFALFRGNNQKRKANRALSSAYKEIEEKNKNITDSINYSKRIQDASLPQKELKYKLFPDAFVLFKPKDIVSGDFYWYTEKNGKRLIASCDCTGHGVPGALMSMIGMNFLNQIVYEKEITSPDEILNLLHKEIRKALKQDYNGETKDGMDIALVSFSSESEIEYAGAQRPLWIIRAVDDEILNVNDIQNKDLNFEHSNFELIEIKPDKFSIGGQQSETERKFTNHKISLSKGNAVYIFSDGFADQFGGAEGKKFMSKKFKELLLANYKLPMMEQETALTSALKIWKGAREQVDDILVIGVRI